MRIILLLVLVAGLVGYIYQQRRVNYPLEPITTPTGRSFRAATLKPFCEAPNPCIHRAVYLTELTDTAAIKEEARLLLPWVQRATPTLVAPAAVQLIAVRPGFLQVAPPKAAYSIGFGLVHKGGEWQYIQLEDLTSGIARMLKGA